MLSILKNKQIRYLFLSSFAVLFTGMGLFPILPLYAAEFQASNSLIGLYFAAMYAANALGPVVAGWMITRVSKRLAFIATSMVGLPALVLLASAQNFVQVIVFTSLLWFSGGAVLAIISILTGLHTDSASQGKAFSLMAMVGPLGSLIGGAVVGRAVTWSGYSPMFLMLAVVWSQIPLIGWWFIKDVTRGAKHSEQAKQSGAQSTSANRLGGQFARLMVVVFLGSVAVNVSRFGSSLSMQAANYSAEHVSSAAMISGLVAIPFTLVIGSLADRLGRKHFLTISFLFTLSASLILVNAGELWQYWLASVLNMLAYSVSGAMAQALTSEVVPAVSLDRGLSWLGALGAAASILCFAVSGLLIDLLGLAQVFLLASLVTVLAGTMIEVLFRSRSSAKLSVDCGMTSEVPLNK